MRVYIQTDLEGVAGVTYFENRKNDSEENLAHRIRMRKLLTNEVNAAVLGAYDAGAETVLVNDSHGACYNMIFEDLDPRCELTHGLRTCQPWLPEMDGTWDAMVQVGMHAMAATEMANLCHSKWIVNDGELYLSEATMAAAMAGEHGVPAVFVSGDQYIVEEVRERIPETGYAIVKKSLGPYQTRTLMPRKSCDLIRRGVGDALRRRGEIAPFTIAGPIRLNLLESYGGNHNQQLPVRRVLKDDVCADSINEAVQTFLSSAPWSRPEATLPDGFEYPW